jgi:acetolactate synthase regulatory subunit
LFDWLVTVLEGARRRGFQIARMAAAQNSRAKDEFMERLKERSNGLIRAHELSYK